MTRSTPLFLGLLFVLLQARCGGVNEINVAAPQPAAPAPADSLVARGSVSVTLRAADAPLPEPVSEVRFRVSEVGFIDREGNRIRRLAERLPIRIGERERRSQTILSTELPAVQVDSVAVTFSDVYVEFGPNAGGPLTVRANPLVLSASFEPDPTRLTALTLVYQPGGSVVADSALFRWRFEPSLLVQVGSEQEDARDEQP